MRNAECGMRNAEVTGVPEGHWPVMASPVGCELMEGPSGGMREEGLRPAAHGAPIRWREATAPLAEGVP